MSINEIRIELDHLELKMRGYEDANGVTSFELYVAYSTLQKSLIKALEVELGKIAV